MNREVSSVLSGLVFIVYGSFIKEKVGPGVQRLFGHNLRADLLFHWLGCYLCFPIRLLPEG